MIDFDFTPFFTKYESLVGMADTVFDKVAKEYGHLVKCKNGCSDCCHALFDLTLVEALYIKTHFNQKFSGKQKEALMEKANRADRKTYQIKKEAHKEAQKGKNEVDILGMMALEKVRCPLLNDDDECDLYLYRPITCRFYGIPTEINGMSHTCGKSGFKEGERYPTVKIGVIQRQLYDISEEIVRALNSKHVRMADMIVPLSMAILTEYNEEYLGLAEPEEDSGKGDVDGNGK
jgi:Fe-S-cluster containining protein